MKTFIKLPSGIVLNSERIEYFGNINAVREKERSRKIACYTLSVQFLQRESPITLSYSTKEEAANDYNTLCKICD